MDDGVDSKTRETGGAHRPPAILSAIDICKHFNSSGTRITILEKLDLELRACETLSIVGASGIGKSTLLNVLGTLDRPDSGTLLFQGEDVFLLDDAKLAKFRNEFVGFVFQFHHLLAEFSALENAMMPVLINNQSRENARLAAEEMLVRVGLQDRLSHRVGELSGGEQQRVALARAIVLKPNILLADEPTGNLDKYNSDQVHELLLDLNQELGMTLVVVTHNMDLAACMSRQMTIADGRLI